MSALPKFRDLRIDSGLSTHINAYNQNGQSARLYILECNQLKLEPGGVNQKKNNANITSFTAKKFSHSMQCNMCPATKTKNVKRKVKVKLKKLIPCANED